MGDRHCVDQSDTEAKDDAIRNMDVICHSDSKTSNGATR